MYIISVVLFAIFYNVPTFWIWKLEWEDGKAKIKNTEIVCDATFIGVYYVGLNMIFRFIGPTVCLVVFNIFIYKKVRVNQC